jgi:3-hydroxybutyryl-CoA dehydrogenase
MKIEKITVLGSGVMGSGIAHVVANSGFEVTLWSRRGKSGLERLYAGVQKALERKILNEKQVTLLLSRVKWTASLEESVNQADLIIEVLPEDLMIKSEVFKKTDSCCMQNSILASSTSSLSITSLAECTKRADRVVGMHFFNPAPVMKLVEVVKTPFSSEESINAVVEFSKELGKVPIIVLDTPGFVVNRVLMPMINTAAYLLMDKVAAAETIDLAMQLGANYPLGPLALADYIGIDLCTKILNELYGKLEDPKYKVCPLLEEMVRKGTLGRKTGKGFFNY